jgi:hypothetical protein
MFSVLGSLQYCYAVNDEDTIIHLSYTQTIDSVFKILYQNGIPNNRLIDRAPNDINRENVNGKNRDYNLELDSALEMYSELYYSSFKIDTLLDVFTLIDSAKNYSKTHQGIIPLLYINQKYTEIKKEAFDNNWVQFNGIQLYNNAPINQNIYTEKKAFLTIPLVNVNPIGNNTFIVLPQFCLGKLTQNEKINFGSGYLSILENIPFTISNCSNTIEMLSNEINDTLYCKANVYSIGANNARAKNVGTLIPDSFALAVNGKTHYYGVWWGCENTSKCMKKPVIIVEGYDPANTRFLYIANPSTKSNSLYNVANEQGMADNFRNYNYDVVILNFNTGLDALEDQAEVVKALIRELKTKIAACGSNQEFTFIGPSSGGIITRYALADMEGNGEDHNTKMFFSFDSPHKGANVPLGLQHLVTFMANTIPITWVAHKNIKAMKGAFNATPTKELLIYHDGQTSNQKAKPDPKSTSFFNTLNNLNGGVGYPTKCRNIAVSDGDGSGSGYGFNPGDKLYAINKFYGYVNIITDGWAIPNQTKQKVFSGIATVGLHPPIPTNISVFRVKNTEPYDNAPGGQGDFIELAVNGIGGHHSDCKVSPCRQDFIPLISALDLQNTTNLNYDVKANITGSDGIAYKGIDYTSAVTKFDAIYVSSANEPHVINGVTTGIAHFIKDEIMPDDLYLQNKTITKAVDYEAYNTIEMGRNISTKYVVGDFNYFSIAGTSIVRSGTSINLKSGATIKPINGGKVVLKIEPFQNCYPSFRLQESNNNSNINAPNDNDINIATHTSLNNNEINVLCFPNPFAISTTIQIELKNELNMQVILYNALGQVAKQITNNQFFTKGVYQFQISKDELALGLYILQIQTDKGQTHQSIIIQ